MRPSLKWALTATDVAFMVYWSIALLECLGLISIPSDWLYAHAHDPRVVAWNWSFFPLDIAFSITGLWAVHAASQGNPIWRPLALISLVLTIVAGSMACGYWLLLGEVDAVWFGMNAVLVIWPLVFLPALVREMAVNSASAN
ncbi:DUF5360 family protein [Aquidulcibacter sp.]|jgi:hypothetical protein|uniref:DUF5360 family protein n=1 Tax=Aquidulcibacter sp. TaxID=2052990 RepID=UPI0037831807